MIIYIEYVLAENFVLDALLLTLSLHAAKAPKNIKNIFFSSLLGGVFALLLPLCNSSVFILGVLKIGTGFLLCFVAFPHLKTKKDIGMYAIICFFFFVFSFTFAGALFAVFTVFTRQNNTYILTQVPIALVLASFLFLCLLCVYYIKKLYQKKHVFSHIYDCYIPYNKRNTHILGFLDSGNRATKNQLPVCFISPMAAWDIWGNVLFSFYDPASNSDVLEDIATSQKQDKQTRQVCDQLQNSNEQRAIHTTVNPPKVEHVSVSTVSGKKQLPCFLGEVIVIYHGQRIKSQVYFAVSTHIVFQEYALLLPSTIVDTATIYTNNL